MRNVQTYTIFASASLIEIANKQHNYNKQQQTNTMAHRILIAGAGGIGQATGLILAEKSDFDCEIFIGDRYSSASDDAKVFIEEGADAKGIVHPFVIPESGINDEFKDILNKCDIILDCLPGSQAPRLAQLANDYDLHYANLTEYVNETNQVTEIAKNSEKGFILQTGLAPGFINVLAMKLFNEFTSKYNVDKVQKIQMKVGALSDHVLAPHFYAFTWSPIGVATEYVKDAIAVRNYETVTIKSLADIKGLIIDGNRYEESFTSGGAADLPEALAGKVADLDYQTLRHPGHYEWAKKIIDNTKEGEDTIQHLEKTMLQEIPSVEDDRVIIYSTVIGEDSNGRLRALEASYNIKPTMVGSKKLRAIQTTTAAPLCEAAYMLLTQKLKGPIFQSMIDPDKFINGPFVKAIYG